MDMIPVQSSNIESIGYESSTETLHVRFTDGSTYEYKGVPSFIYDGLMSASSHGSFLNREIKNQYPYEKIG